MEAVASSEILVNISNITRRTSLDHLIRQRQNCLWT